jgi:hypothetical protein
VSIGQQPGDEHLGEQNGAAPLLMTISGRKDASSAV